ncbi:FAD-binding protein [Streptomyces sp. NPDC059010]|uniref:FAD-binding protein n=1 Tax=Streptomyces sp. NPDC059010 TaxID=3346695 RepID=UPI0036899206
MTSSPSRRTALRGLAVTGATVIGFDPFTRSWAAATPTADASRLKGVPDLDGTLLTDTASRTAVADDYGHIVHRAPAAVLRPGSVRDVVTMVRFCNTHGIEAAPRGQGHATQGQGQIDGGLVVEMTPLASIGPVDTGSSTVTVGAGAKWSDVAKATLAHGLTPPVFTDYLELSVGGTLSVGGFGGQAHRHGAQVDNVVALEVVTGAGELLHCSAIRHADLFHAVRAGLGQCAIIVGATLRLVPAPETVRHYLLPYADLRTYVDDQRRLAEDERFDYLEGQLTADDSGVYRGGVIEAVAYGPPAGQAPDDTALLRGLRHDPQGAQITDLPYYDFLDRVAPAVAELKESGLWYWAHPWLNLLLPGARTADITREILASLTPDDVGPGLVLLYPIRRERLTAPFLRVPDDPVPYLFAILRATPPDDRPTIDRLLKANRSAYDIAYAAGGRRYPVGSVPFTERDWHRHFGPAWPALAAARRRHDPKGVLGAGQGIFNG